MNPLTTRQNKESAANKLNEEYIVSDEQAKIFRMRYIDGKDIGCIADLLGYSRSYVRDELAIIRQMLDKVI